MQWRLKMRFYLNSICVFYENLAANAAQGALGVIDKNDKGIKMAA